ncbi:MAG: Mpo1-like protein [Bdellovibrionota bacterium]
MNHSALRDYFKDYGLYHRTPGNQICHLIGIPLLTVTFLGLLATVGGAGVLGTPRIDLGLVLWCLASLWYLFLDWRLGLPFSVVALGGYFVGRSLPVPTLWILFVLGWVFQGIGHAVYEKRSPAFFKNVLHLLIGPLWVFAKCVGYQLG